MNIKKEYVAIAGLILTIGALILIQGNTKPVITDTVKVTGYWEPASPSGNIVWVAEDRGYLPGIKIEEVYVAQMADRAATISSGRADFAHLTYFSAIRAIAKGVKIKAVVAAHGTDSNFSTPTFFVLADSDIKGPSDLKGKKAGFRPGSTSHLVFSEYLKRGGLTDKDVTFQSIPQGQEEQVLRNKQVDIIVLLGIAQISGIKERGGVRELFNQNEILPKGMHHCGLFISEKFINEKPELLNKFLDGFVKGADWEKANPEQTKEIFAKYVKDRKSKPEYIRKWFEPLNIRDHALVDDSDVQWFIDRLVESGELKPGEVKPSDVYTNKFNPYGSK